jgi:hypothetical protein
VQGDVSTALALFDVVATCMIFVPVVLQNNLNVIKAIIAIFSFDDRVAVGVFFSIAGTHRQGQHEWAKCFEYSM